VETGWAIWRRNEGGENKGPNPISDGGGGDLADLEKDEGPLLSALTQMAWPAWAMLISGVQTGSKSVNADLGSGAGLTVVVMFDVFADVGICSNDCWSDHHSNKCQGNE
jgi:hypothetical protein